MAFELPTKIAPRSAWPGAPKRTRVPVLGWLLVSAWVGCAGENGGAGAGGGGQSGCPGACEPGSYRCSEEYLLTCVDDCTWSLAKTCDSAALCDGNAGRCRVCDPTETRCTGTVWEGCAEDGSGWRVLEDCAGQCLDTGCDPCAVPDELRCADADPADADAATPLLQQCLSGVGWQDLESCTSEAVCVETLREALSDPAAFGGGCLPPVCEPGERRCDPENPTYVQTCADTGVSWRVIVVCSAGQVCQANTDGTPSCTDAAGS